MLKIWKYGGIAAGAVMLAGAVGAGGGAPRGAVDDPHFAKDIAGPKVVQQPAAMLDDDTAVAHEKHVIGGLALGEDRLAVGIGPRRQVHPRQDRKVDFRLHRNAPSKLPRGSKYDGLMYFL